MRACDREKSETLVHAALKESLARVGLWYMGSHALGYKSPQYGWNFFRLLHTQVSRFNYPKSLEPKNGPAQGAVFSLLATVKAQFPHAVTWRDLGVVIPSNSHTTASALAALASYSGGERFEADKLANSGMETSEHSLAHLHSLAEGEEHESANAPKGYTRGMQDPKHRGQMLRSPIKDAWITAEKLEMEGLTRRKCWIRVHRSTLTAQDKVFSTRFHYKLSVSKGNSKSARCVLLSKVNICIERMNRDVGILRTLSARSRMPVVSA